MDLFLALFDWRSRQRRGSLQSEAFSEPVFQKHGKLVTFFRGFVLPRTIIGKTRRKRKVFQVDLAEHLFSVGSVVPPVVSLCCDFIESHGVVDGVYRLSGISSNIQRLKKSFDCDSLPDLAKDRQVLQDIHSVSSLVKLYFRELPVPVCTFNLYDEFVAAVKAPEDLRILKLREVLSELPEVNYTTLEFLLKHLHRLSLRHSDTGMTAKNLAIVWAPNLLRSPALEVGGVAALQGVAVQAVVTEYLIKYCHLVFTSHSQSNTPRAGFKSPPQAFPISSPIKLLSLEEAQRQYQNITSRATHILPLETLTLNRKKKEKPWRVLFPRRRTDQDILEEENSSSDLCSASHRLGPDLDTLMESKSLLRRGESQEDSPVILRCLRRLDSETSTFSREKRSSLRDKFRKFALSPISSSQNIVGKLTIESELGLAGQHVNQKILHLNESLEFIDASSDEEDNCEVSPSNKRSKICEVMETSSGDKARQELIKEKSSDKSGSNQEFGDENCKKRSKEKQVPDTSKVTGEIKSNENNSETFPVAQSRLLQDEDSLKEKKDSAGQCSERENTKSGSSVVAGALPPDCRTEAETRRVVARLGQTESRWDRNAVKDRVREEDQTDPSEGEEGVIVGRLSVVFDDKNKCEKSSGQVKAEPPFPSSIRSLTLATSQKQKR